MVDYMIEQVVLSHPRIERSLISNFIVRMVNANLVFATTEGFALFFRLDSDSLRRIQASPDLLINPATCKEFMVCGGRHIHFIGVYSKRHGLKNGLRLFLEKENPLSVSWYNRNLKFVRRYVCHQLL